MSNIESIGSHKKHHNHHFHRHLSPIPVDLTTKISKERVEEINEQTSAVPSILGLSKHSISPADFRFSKGIYIGEKDIDPGHIEAIKNLDAYKIMGKNKDKFDLFFKDLSQSESRFHFEKVEQILDAFWVIRKNGVTDFPSCFKKPGKIYYFNNEENIINSIKKCTQLSYNDNKEEGAGSGTISMDIVPHPGIDLFPPQDLIDPICTKVEVCDIYSMLTPEEDTSTIDTMLTTFVELSKGIPTNYYLSAKAAMKFYRERVHATNDKKPEPLQFNIPNLEFTIKVEGNDYQLLSSQAPNPALPIYHNTNAMKVWNYLAFYGSYRNIGQWLHKDNLFGKEMFKVIVKMRPDINTDSDNINAHHLWMSTMNSYVTLAQYTGGRPYAPLKGKLTTDYDKDYMSAKTIWGYHANDQAIMVSNTPNVHAEINTLIGLYSAGVNLDNKKDLINNQIHERITPETFANCYKLVIDNANLLTTCNIRVFELFAPVVLAETHRDSYTTVINAAMLDLFAANNKVSDEDYSLGNNKRGFPNKKGISNYAINNFYDFFGQPFKFTSQHPTKFTKKGEPVTKKVLNENYHAHNLAFGGATDQIAGATGSQSDGKLGTRLNWYHAHRTDGKPTAEEREKTVTKDWLNLLYNYKCWLLTHDHLDGINGGGRTYNGASAKKKETWEKRVYFGDECPANTKDNTWNFHDVNTKMRPEFKIYAAYQSIKQFNYNLDLSNPNNVNAVRDKIAAFVVGVDDPNNHVNFNLFTDISNCINDDASIGNTHACNTVHADAEQLAICKDVFCGLLEHNTMTYL